MLATRDALHQHVARLGEELITVGALLDAARSTHAEIPERDASEDVRLSFHCTPRANPCKLNVELVWHWPRPEQLDAPPGRLWLRFDVDAREPAREADLRCRDYPHVAAFVNAALDAAALDPSAVVSDVHVELECEHMS